MSLKCAACDEECGSDGLDEEGLCTLCIEHFENDRAMDEELMRHAGFDDESYDDEEDP